MIISGKRNVSDPPYSTGVSTISRFVFNSSPDTSTSIEMNRLPSVRATSSLSTFTRPSNKVTVWACNTVVMIHNNRHIMYILFIILFH